MQDKELTKVQHFISRFILRNFLTAGKFKFFDKRYKKFSDKNPKGSMYKEYFYEHDDFAPNEIEDLLATRENVYAPIIKKLLEGKALTLDEHMTLIEFRHVTYYRSSEFTGFHNYQKDRGEDSWMERWDWKSINGIFNSDDPEKDIKKSQLRAIKEVIEREDPIFKLSAYTPICFLFTTKGKKFMLGDNGSVGIGEEFTGMVVIVLSPTQAVAFPRINKAAEIMQKVGVKSNQSTIIYEDAPDEIVDIVNERVKRQSFEYYIDPNEGDSCA